MNKPGNTNSLKHAATNFLLGAGIITGAAACADIDNRPTPGLYSPDGAADGTAADGTSLSVRSMALTALDCKPNHEKIVEGLSEFNIGVDGKNRVYSYVKDGNFYYTIVPDDDKADDAAIAAFKGKQEKVLVLKDSYGVQGKVGTAIIKNGKIIYSTSTAGGAEVLIGDIQIKNGKYDVSNVQDEPSYSLGGNLALDECSGSTLAENTNQQSIDTQGNVTTIKGLEVCGSAHMPDCKVAAVATYNEKKFGKPVTCRAIMEGSVKDLANSYNFVQGPEKASDGKTRNVENVRFGQLKADGTRDMWYMVRERDPKDPNTLLQTRHLERCSLSTPSQTNPDAGSTDTTTQPDTAQQPDAADAGSLDADDATNDTSKPDAADAKDDTQTPEDAGQPDADPTDTTTQPDADDTTTQPDTAQQPDAENDTQTPEDIAKDTNDAANDAADAEDTEKADAADTAQPDSSQPDASQPDTNKPDTATQPPLSKALTFKEGNCTMKVVPIDIAKGSEEVSVSGTNSCLAHVSFSMGENPAEKPMIFKFENTKDGKIAATCVFAPNKAPDCNKVASNTKLRITEDGQKTKANIDGTEVTSDNSDWFVTPRGEESPTGTRTFEVASFDGPVTITNQKYSFTFTVDGNGKTYLIDAKAKTATPEIPDIPDVKPKPQPQPPKEGCSASPAGAIPNNYADFLLALGAAAALLLARRKEEEEA